MLKISNLSVKRGENIILDDVSFKVHEHKLISLVGPSGCGKSTLLHTIAGFISPLKGSITLHGKDLISTPIDKRSIGLVFQEETLFPNLSVRENIEYGISSWEISSREKRVNELLELVNLTSHASKLPHELSGGEKQRVSLVRALAPQPKLILMDESFSSLDPVLRVELREEIKVILKKLAITCILVTHDRDEAMSFSDEVVILNDSKIQQFGTPSELYLKPDNEFVAKFFGNGNIVKDGDSDYIKPGYYHHVDISDKGKVEGKIVRRKFNNGQYYYDVAVIGTEIVFTDIANREAFDENSKTTLALSKPWCYDALCSLNE